MELVRDGKSPYVVVVGREATPVERKAAAELVDHLALVSGARLPVVTDEAAPADHEICVGATARAPAGGRRPAGVEAFKVHADGERLHVEGGSDRGTLYGVYGLLERFLGCRWLSSKVSVVPRSPDVVLKRPGFTDAPRLDYREVYYRDAWDPAYAERNRLNGHASALVDGRMQEKHRGWGTWCHTFEGHVPPARHFASHPEYYALVDGKRIDNGQLCLTNPAVFDLVVEDVRRRMAAEPEATSWSVSQNDCFRNCSCPSCSAIDKREGTPMGSLLEFVNRVAAVFPDKTISTLAYQYTRKPPRHLRPAGNVHIMLCGIECNRSRPIAEDPDSVTFRDDVESWARICDRIFIWDYVIQFANLVSPFPNLRVLAPNMRFFVEHHARGMFAQGNRERGGELAELRAWLLAKLEWDPSYDVDKGIDEFLAGFYGKAAGPIRAYLDLTHDTLEENGVALRIFEGPRDARETYLTEPLLVRYRGLFDEAERAVATEPEVLLRVREARLPLMYAQVQLGYGEAKERRALLEGFREVARRTGLEKVEEWKLTVPDWIARAEQEL